MGGRVGAREHDAFRLGQRLRAAREAMGWDLHAASAATAIPVPYLSALEEGDLSALPSPVYTRGYVRTYATVLHLDGDAFTYAFTRLQPQGRFDRLGSTAPTGPRRPSSPGPPRRWLRVVGFVLGAFMVLLVINAIWAAIGPGGDGDSSIERPGNQQAAPTSTTPPASVAPPVASGPIAPLSSDSEGAVYAVGRPSFGVSVEPTGRVWVFVRKGEDGDVVYEGTLTSGENQAFSAENQLWIRVGNQANVRISVDGRPLTFPGTTDEPYNIQLQP